MAADLLVNYLFMVLVRVSEPSCYEVDPGIFFLEPAPASALAPAPAPAPAPTPAPENIFLTFFGVLTITSTGSTYI